MKELLGKIKKRKLKKQTFIIICLLLVLFQIPILLKFRANTALLLIYLISLNIFIYLSLFDIFYKAVPDRFTLVLLSLAFIINLGLLILNRENILIIKDFSPGQNFVSSAIFGGIFLFIVVLTREKGMGSGDARAMFILGLILGQKLLLGFYIAIIFALIWGVLKKIKPGTFTEIPFIPFLTTGMYASLLVEMDLVKFFMLGY